MNKKYKVSYSGEIHILAEGERKLNNRHNTLILYLLEVIECYGEKSRAPNSSEW